MNDFMNASTATPRFPSAPSSVLPAVRASWPTVAATAGHVSAAYVGTGSHLGMTAVVPVASVDRDLRPTAIGAAKQARPPRGVPR
jgi:hypothetical protein